MSDTTSLSLSVSVATEDSDNGARELEASQEVAAPSMMAGDGLLGDELLRWQGEDFRIGRLLGSGKFASVFTLASTAPGGAEDETVVAKVTRLAALSPWARAQLKHEEEIWRALQHPHIVRCFGCMLDGARHVLLLERAPGGELFEWIMDATSFNEAQAARQVYQLLDAVQYMHGLGVLHRDLKPENLLLASADADADVKVVAAASPSELAGGKCRRGAWPRRNAYGSSPHIQLGSHDCAAVSIAVLAEGSHGDRN